MARTFVCKRSDVPENSMKECDAGGGTRVLVANAGGSIVACQHMCPHQDVPLCEGLFDGAVLTCHQHLWQWDIHTGAPIGLAESPLECFRVEVDGDDVYIASGEGGGLDMGELFLGIPAGTLGKLTALARREEVPAGGTLYAVGDPADDVFVLQSGRIAFVIGRDERVANAGFSLRKGEVFGWAALLENHPSRIAKATCLEASVVARINGRQALEILAVDAQAGYVVMRRLSSLIARYLASPGAS